MENKKLKKIAGFAQLAGKVEIRDVFFMFLLNTKFSNYFNSFNKSKM